MKVKEIALIVSVLFLVSCKTESELDNGGMIGEICFRIMENMSKSSYVPNPYLWVNGCISSLAEVNEALKEQEKQKQKDTQ